MDPEDERRMQRFNVFRLLWRGIGSREIKRRARGPGAGPETALNLADVDLVFNGKGGVVARNSPPLIDAYSGATPPHLGRLA